MDKLKSLRELYVGFATALYGVALVLVCLPIFVVCKTLLILADR